MRKTYKRKPVPQDAEGNLLLEITREPIPRPNVKKKISHNQKERVYLALWEAYRVMERIEKDSRDAQNFFVNSSLGMNKGGEFDEMNPEIEQDLAIYKDTIKNLKAAIKVFQ